MNEMLEVKFDGRPRPVTQQKRVREKNLSCLTKVTVDNKFSNFSETTKPQLNKQLTNMGSGVPRSNTVTSKALKKKKEEKCSLTVKDFVAQYIEPKNAPSEPNSPAKKGYESPGASTKGTKNQDSKKKSDAKTKAKQKIRGDVFVGRDQIARFKRLVLNQKKDANWQRDREKWTWDRLFNLDDEASKAVGKGMDQNQLDQRIFDLFSEVKERVEHFQSIDPAPMEKVQLITPGARQILLKRGKLAKLQKMDIALFEDEKNQETIATSAGSSPQKKKKMTLEELTKQPLLKMRSDRPGGHEILYSDLSLKRLALNDTSNYFDGYERQDLTNL